MNRTSIAIIAVLIVSNALTVIPASAGSQAAKVEIRGTPAAAYSADGVLNVGNITASPDTTGVKWTPYSFSGFFYDLKYDLGKETLIIVNAEGTTLTDTRRTIEEKDLIYKTQGQGKMLNVVKNGFGKNYSAAKEAGLEKFDASPPIIKNGQYMVVGWQAGKYVGLKGRIDKLTKLLFEHGTAVSEKKTLTVGETWNMGEGWTLTANAIDARASPRQVWLTLSKDSVKKDDKTIQQGRIYTYVEKSIANESDVPLFVTFVDSVFSGATGDMVQLRFTWLLSGNVTTIKTEDEFGIFKVDTIDNSNKQIIMNNKDSSIDLSKNSEQTLMGNLKFRVADSDTLRFYPKVDYEIQGASETSKPISLAAATVTSTLTATATPTAIIAASPITPATQTKPAVAAPPLKVPGFEAFLAIAGFLAVGYMMLRKSE